MMKKFFSLAAIAAVVASMTLTACGPSSPEDYAAKTKELAKELTAAQESKDEAKITEAQKAVDEFQKEVDEKLKDAEFKAAYKKALAEEAPAAE